MVESGQKVRFEPFNELTGFGANDHKGKPVTGKVVAVYRRQKWFLVEYMCGGVCTYTSFKFSQIGKEVVIIG